ncbi:ssDNA binding protein [Gordonia phage Neville]|uniref:SsDNA binding protein n=1 Tax=Gordonia phage Neville TaxID=2301693 RepID=A0A385DYD4_9CAUD|nr:ssDNA binding protein [Gordonia phage Neville]AXQ64441.1 ssDNA binding protein [Gordonia phage Neville]
MAMPTITGQGMIFAGKDAEFAFGYGQSGKAWLKATIGVSASRKNDYGEYERTKEANIDVSAFGSLAEQIQESIAHKDIVNFTLRLDGTDTFEKKDGTTNVKLTGTLDSIGKVDPRD